MVYGALLALFLSATSLASARLFFGPSKELLVFDWYAWEFLPLDRAAGLQRFALGGGMLAFQAQLVVAVCFMFTCLNVRSSTAIVAPILVIFLDLVLKNMPFFKPYERFFLEYHSLCWSRVFHPYVPWADIGQSLTILAAWIVTFCVVGYCAFMTRDFKND
jgi:hypothetical protein